MNTSKKTHLMSCLNQCAIFYCLALTVIVPAMNTESRIGMRNNLIYAFLMVPATLISYILYATVQKAGPYFLGHIVVIVAVALTLPTIPAVTIGVLTVILMLLHIVDSNREIRAQSNTDNPDKSEIISPILAPQLFDAIIYVAVFFINHLTFNNRAVDLSVMYCCAISVLVFCLYNYEAGMDRFFNLNKNQAGYTVPAKQIRSTGKMLITIFMVILGAVILFLPLSGLQGLIDLCNKGIFALLGWIFSKFPQPTTAGNEPIVPESPVEPMDFSKIQSSSYTPPIWLNRLITIVITVVAVAAIIFLLVIVIRAIYIFFRSYTGPAKAEEKDGLNYVETKKYIAPGKKASKIKDDTSTPSGIVRKLYRHTIRSYRKRNTEIPAYQTPSEIESFVSIPVCEERNALHELYEKARYSKGGCTQADAEYVKSLARNKIGSNPKK